MNKAKELAWEKIKVGLTDKFKVTLTQDLVQHFLKVSGDFNPLHSSQAYAKGTKFGQVVVPGMLLSSFFSRLIGMHIPGKNALYFSQTLAFKNPAYIGDTITVKGTVTHIFNSTKMITLVTTISNAKTKKLLVDGQARALYI